MSLGFKNSSQNIHTPNQQRQMSEYCYIVHTRCPPGTDIQREKIKFKKEYRAVLLTRKPNCEENLKQLLIDN